jgi:hypothetical protein
LKVTFDQYHHRDKRKTKIPAEFWADLKAQNLIEQNAPVSQMAPAWA